MLESKLSSNHILWSIVQSWILSKLVNSFRVTSCMFCWIDLIFTRFTSFIFRWNANSRRLIRWFPPTIHHPCCSRLLLADREFYHFLRIPLHILSHSLPIRILAVPWYPKRNHHHANTSALKICYCFIICIFFDCNNHNPSLHRL